MLGGLLFSEGAPDGFEFVVIEALVFGLVLME